MRIATLSLALAGLLLVATIGCQGRSSIPSSSHLVQSGRNGLSYTATEPGNVYVLDADNNKKVFEGHMNQGDQIIVKPSVDQIVLAGNNANHSEALKPDHNYEIHFDPTAKK